METPFGPQIWDPWPCSMEEKTADVPLGCYMSNPAPIFSAAMRSLLQTSTNQGFTPEETTGIIVGFCVLGFMVLLLTIYAAVLTSKVETHPKLQKTIEDELAVE
ncbi:hypothetical protein ACK3TF_005145 [Chlorella vulgaris]